MKYDTTDDTIPPGKMRVLDAAGAAVTLAACAEARRLRSEYLRRHGWDYVVLSAGDLLDRVETILQDENLENLQPKLDDAADAVVRIDNAR